MTRWVNSVDGVIAGVGIAVEGLGMGRVGDEGVGGDEAGEGGGVVAGVVVEEAEVAVFFLSCETGVGDGLAGDGAVAAEGLVAGIGTGEFATGAFGQVAGAAEVVGFAIHFTATNSLAFPNRKCCQYLCKFHKNFANCYLLLLQGDNNSVRYGYPPN